MFPNVDQIRARKQLGSKIPKKSGRAPGAYAQADLGNQRQSQNWVDVLHGLTSIMLLMLMGRISIVSFATIARRAKTGLN